LEGLMGPEEDERHLRDMRKRERTEAKEGQLRGLLRQRGLGADKFGNPDLNVTRAADKTVLGGGPRPNGETVYIATAKMDPPTLLMKQNGLSQHVWYQSQQQPAAWLSYLNFNLQREIQFEATGNYYSKPYPSSITMTFEKSKPETIAYLRKIGVLKPEGVPPPTPPPPTPGNVYLVRAYNPDAKRWEELSTPNGDMARKLFSDTKQKRPTGYVELQQNGKVIDKYGTMPRTVPPAPAPTKKSGCFIATAAFGTPLDPRINVLRQFRDDRLMVDPLGRAFVKSYYTLSPPVAHAVSMSETLKRMVRGLIAPMVRGR